MSDDSTRNDDPSDLPRESDQLNLRSELPPGDRTEPPVRKDPLFPPVISAALHATPTLRVDASPLSISYPSPWLAGDASPAARLTVQSAADSLLSLGPIFNTSLSLTSDLNRPTFEDWLKVGIYTPIAGNFGLETDPSANLPIHSLGLAELDLGRARISKSGALKFERTGSSAQIEELEKLYDEIRRERDLLRTKLETDRAGLVTKIAQMKEVEVKERAAFEQTIYAATEEAKRNFEALMRNDDLQSVISRIHPSLRTRLLGDEDFRNQFVTSRPCVASVLSVDIRRSTELMLKAKSAQGFADFLTMAFAELREIILAEYGFFDKFTGDGLLAFFPEFLSGPDAQYHAQRAARLCHEAFRRSYLEHHAAFKTVLDSIGLGIGIDHGMVHIANVAGSVTVVGEPVVYACRFSVADVGKTYLNRGALEEASLRFPRHFSFREVKVDLKHEGVAMAYEAMLLNDYYLPAPAAHPLEPANR